MENKYLVVTGNEYGIDLLNNCDLNFVGIEKAEEKYDNFLEEYGCATMFKIEEDKIVEVKSEADF